MARRAVRRVLTLLGLTAALTAAGSVTSVASVPSAASADSTSAGSMTSVASSQHVVTADLPAICRQHQRIICISKTERTLRYLEGGQEWLTAEVRFGRVGYETPTGTWSVATKDPSSWWSYPYRVYMPWGMKFDTRDGLYIHYSSGFALNPQGYIGSHGCVQLGDWETARTLYQRVAVNTTVHIY